MNLFWIESKNDKTKQCVYPIDQLNNLVFYYDSTKLLRCLEKETLQYLKTYEISYHPITLEPIPDEILASISTINVITEPTNIAIAQNIFQILSNMSIFIDYELFLNLQKEQLLKFNYEIRDFWIQNFTDEQRVTISNKVIFSEVNENLEKYNLVNLQNYLLNQMQELLLQEKEEYKYMINSIIVGALGIVIPDIKNFYPDFNFSF